MRPPFRYPNDSHLVDCFLQFEQAIHSLLFNLPIHFNRSLCQDGCPQDIFESCSRFQIVSFEYRTT